MFKVIRLEEESNVYMVVRDISKLPFMVYGFLRVNGSTYSDSTISYKNISEDVRPYLIELEEQARLDLFPID